MRIRFLKWRIVDALRYSQVLRHVWAVVHCVRGSLSQDKLMRLDRFTKALEFCEWPFAWHTVIRLLNKEREGVTLEQWQELVMRKPRYHRLIKQQPQLTRTIILKAPAAGGEKGVIVAYFEYNLARLLKLSPEDFRWLDENYHIVFAASWSPTDYALLILAAERMKSPLFVQPANHLEREKLAAVHPGIQCVPGLACDWVNPIFYQPKPVAERSIDLLMVANWGAFKRHWEFFDALRHLPSDLKIVLVGQHEGGRDKNYILRLARQIGVPQTLDIRESLGIEEVSALQCDARVSIILSRREGGCVAAVESLFAGCALAMRTGAHIGSSAHIGPQTGQWLTPGKMNEDLAALLARSASLKPREWAIENIRHDLTLQRINAMLRKRDEEQGRPWTQDLAIPHWRPYPALEFPADRARLAPALKLLCEKFPAVFPVDLQ